MRAHIIPVPEPQRHLDVDGPKVLRDAPDMYAGAEKRRIEVQPSQQFLDVSRHSFAWSSGPGAHRAADAQISFLRLLHICWRRGMVHVHDAPLSFAFPAK